MQGDRQRRPMGGEDGYINRILPYGLSFLLGARRLKKLRAKTSGYG
jgi:hypothetical protein